MQMTKASGAWALMPSPTVFHDLEVDAEQIVAAHARLAGDAGGDDADVGARDVGIVGRAFQLGVEIVDRAGLGNVERLTFGDALRDVEQDDVAKLPHRGEVGERSADHSGADQRDLLAGHGSCRFLCCFGARRGPAQRFAGPLDRCAVRGNRGPSAVLPELKSPVREMNAATVTKRLRC